MAVKTDPAGVPQPSTTDELRQAFDDAPKHGFIESPPNTEYVTDETLDMPEHVEWDGQGSTVVLIDDDDAAGVRLNDRSRAFRVSVDMGASSGAGFLVDSAVARHNLDTIPVSGTVTAESGSGTRGVFFKADQERMFGHSFSIACDGVDVPVDMWSPRDTDGSNDFMTSIYGDVLARDFEIGIRARGAGESTVNSTLFRVQMTPGDRTETLSEVDHDDAAQNVTIGTCGDASRYDQLVHVKETRHPPYGARAKAMHDFFSFDGYSSDRSPGLVRNEADYDYRDGETPQVIDCSEGGS
jgi:hypothetical protein